MTAKFNTINEALNDLKAGKVIIVCDDENRENEGDFVALAEFATPEIVNFMITHGRGLLCMPLSEEYAHRLALMPMVNNNTDTLKTAFTVSIDHISNGTGISAYDRATTISKVLDLNSIATDFRRPGHVFPLIAKSRGVFARAGHTEATVDLAKLCNSQPVGVICEIINVDGSMARGDDLYKVAQQFNLKRITIKDLISYRRINEKLVNREAVANLPTQLGKFKIYAYSNLLDANEHVAIVKGDLTHLDTPPLVRIHSECLTGDVFHSYRCDCGEQLNLALAAIEQAPYGVLIYLRQEGRGIGLINKIKAYALQETGVDTVDANLQLGFAGDLRDYTIAVQILKDMGIHKIRLITNNPCKMEELAEAGIHVVERISLKTAVHPENAKYLATKVEKFGHLL
ncbi:MAG: bifunctional 3,4-dihydroxy-2-butanone-4-phosphate synthase/GTP cyclohydrolase II [Burkholderiales bacterium]|nr:bifunctional 3,4-dihydroxy-2-butanone-4-phosphate synthase/GTP cyclohydrolase II [Burkholderiales bacterium]